MIDNRLVAPAVARNRDPILDVLRTILPPRGTVLEIASGSGEHVVHFAMHLPTLTFQPTDTDPKSRDSIAAWVASSRLPNIMAPLALDASRPNWPIESADALVCINMIHISPWRATEGLFDGAAAILAPGAPLYLYGPYKRNGAHTAPSNVAFDASLRGQNSSWGVRDLEAVVDCASARGFSGPQIVNMPANNLSVIFRKSG